MAIVQLASYLESRIHMCDMSETMGDYHDIPASQGVARIVQVADFHAKSLHVFFREHLIND